MNTGTEMIEKEEKVNLIKELTEGYQIRRREENELTLDWDATSDYGI
jgi:hypothetical protein